ncbi:hypothetical protein [Aurantivibrio plasticivorans]
MSGAGSSDGSKSKNDPETQRMSEEAQAFVELSNKLLNEALATCQLEPFKPVPLEVPSLIQPDKEPPPSISQEALWQQINQLYASQNTLFSSAEQTTKRDQCDESDQLDDVTKMLGM